MGQQYCIRDTVKQWGHVTDTATLHINTRRGGGQKADMAWDYCQNTIVSEAAGYAY